MKDEEVGDAKYFASSARSIEHDALLWCDAVDLHAFLRAGEAKWYWLFAVVRLLEACEES